MSLQPQWNLDHTASDGLRISKAILQAATSDNVQVLAILACEKFGATLAMSQATNLKVERDVVPSPDPSPLAFLKLYIGYSANDCVLQLGKSHAGIQFLGLASALVATMDHLNTASVIQSMIMEAASDKTLVPTVRHVRDLVSSIEAKCLRAGFANEVTGWQIMLNASCQKDFQVNRDALLQSHLKSGVSWVPGSQAIQNLVTAFRQLRRIGAEDITDVTIRTSPEHAAWTIAFVKWCLGYPPVVLSAKGTTFWTQEKPEVYIVISPLDNFHITIRSSVNTPSELISPERGRVVQGLIGVPHFGKLMLHTHELDEITNSDGNRALHQAMPYALDQVLDKLDLVHGFGTDLSIEKQNNEVAESMKNASVGPLSAFPQRIAVSEAYTLLYSLKKTIKLPQLEEGLLVRDRPMVATYLNKLSEECDCSDCHSVPPPPDMIEYCKRDWFWKKLSIQVAVTLGLSLFHCPDSLALSIESVYVGNNFLQNEYLTAIFGILAKGEREQCAVESLNNWCLGLVGHHDISNVERSGQLPILSCYKGQAVWLTVHQSYDCTTKGFLSLSWLPGSVIHQKERYNLVLGSGQARYLSCNEPLNTTYYHEPVSQVRNVCPPDLKIFWNIGPKEDRTLEASLQVTGLVLDKYKWNTIETAVRPELLPCLLAKTTLAPDCRHPPSSTLAVPDRFASFFDPLNLPTGKKVEEGYVNIIAVDGSNHLRYLALSYLASTVNFDFKVMVRRSACLACCLNMCRRFGCSVLVL